MSHADTAPPPVFVGGTGCSGSTVVGRLIGEHPSFAFIPHQVRFHAEPWGLPGLLLDRVDIADFAARMRAAWFEQTPRGRQGHLQRVVDEATLEAALIRFERGFGDDRLATSRQLVHDLLDPIAAAEGKPGWVEMTPRNVFHAAALLELFPDAKIIHAVRDGCDTASYLTAKGWVADMDEGLQWWAHRYAQALRSLRGIPEESLFVLALESLVDERREESYAALLRFLEVDDDSALRAFFDAKVTPERAHVGRWRDAVSPEDQARIVDLHDRLVAEQRLPAVAATAPSPSAVTPYSAPVGARATATAPAPPRVPQARTNSGVVNEHFVPDDGADIEHYLALGNRTAVTHLVRYDWACEVLADADPAPSTILDVACGAGYGSSQITERFPNATVVGADYDKSAIEIAKGTYGAPNLEFRHGDVERWDESLGDQQFDCIVSFDTIEHVSHREIMMQNLVEHLASEGMLLLSTPVRTKNILNPGWKHHKIEYSRIALFDFLHRYFEVVLNPDHGTLPRADVIEALNTPEDTVYLMKMNPVVCLRPIRIAFRA